MVIENMDKKLNVVYGNLSRLADPISKRVLTMVDPLKCAETNKGSLLLALLPRKDLESCAGFLQIQLK